MSQCDNDHEEVVYVSRHCPVCEKMKEISYLEKDIERLNEELEAMKESQP
jgi:hypothetical protein